MSNAWTAELSTLLNAILFQPRSQVQLVVLLLIAVAAFAAIMRLSANAVGMKLNSHMRIATICCITLITALFLVLLIRIYLAPKIANASLLTGVQYGAVILSILILVVPIHSWLLKGNYFEALLNIGVSIVGAVLITALCNACWNAVSKGKSEMDRAHERKNGIERDLSQ